MTTAEPRDFTTLQEAIVFFSNPDNCIAYLSAKRWKDGIVRCPNCDSSEVKYLATRRMGKLDGNAPRAAAGAGYQNFIALACFCLRKQSAKSCEPRQRECRRLFPG